MFNSNPSSRTKGRPLRLDHQDAHPPPSRHPPRRSVSNIPLPLLIPFHHPPKIFILRRPPPRPPPLSSKNLTPPTRIFFVYLYQSYKYKVDHTRVNEFGQGGEDEKEDIQAKLASKPLTPPTDSVDATASASDAAGAVVASGREDGQGGGGAKGVRTREGGRTKR